MTSWCDFIFNVQAALSDLSFKRRLPEQIKNSKASCMAHRAALPCSRAHQQLLKPRRAPLVPQFQSGCLPMLFLQHPPTYEILLYGASLWPTGRGGFSVFEGILTAALEIFHSGKDRVNRPALKWRAEEREATRTTQQIFTSVKSEVRGEFCSRRAG